MLYNEDVLLGHRQETHFEPIFLCWGLGLHMQLLCKLMKIKKPEAVLSVPPEPSGFIRHLLGLGGFFYEK